MSKYMTKILKKDAEIECPICKKKHIVTLYNSVNVQVNPELKKKVFEGEINIFPCTKGYLFGQFLYVDDNRWIWIYPDFLINKKEELESMLKNQEDMNNKLFGEGAISNYLVFGYQEFYELSKKLDERGL